MMAVIPLKLASKLHNLCMGESEINRKTIAQPVKVENPLPLTLGVLQRKCACGNHNVAGVVCAECTKIKSGLQRKLAIGASNDPLEREADRVAERVMVVPADSDIGVATPCIQRLTSQPAGQADTAPISVGRVLAHSGRPLEPVLRQDMSNDLPMISQKCECIQVALLNNRLGMLMLMLIRQGTILCLVRDNSCLVRTKDEG